MSLASLPHFPGAAFTAENSFSFPSLIFLIRQKEKPKHLSSQSFSQFRSSQFCCFYFSACLYGLWSEARLNSEGSCWRSQLEHQRGYRQKEEQKELEKRLCNPPAGTTWLEVVGVAYVIKTLAKMTFSPLTCSMHLSKPELEGLIRKGKAWHLFQSVMNFISTHNPGTGLGGH